MAHIGRGVAVDAGAPMTAAYGADGHSHQRASSAEGSESLGGRSSAIVRERLFHAITVAGKGLTPFPRRSLYGDRRLCELIAPYFPRTTPGFLVRTT